MTFQIARNLIEIDGPDLSGKSNFANELVPFLISRGFQVSKHHVTDLTHLEPEKAESTIQVIEEHSDDFNVKFRIYQHLTQNYYREVLFPLANTNEIAIVDRSIHKLFMYAFLSSDKRLRRDLRDDYTSGILTRGLVPAVRIHVLPFATRHTSAVEVIWNRVVRKTREDTLTQDDPKNYQQVVDRVHASGNAWEMLIALTQNAGINFENLWWYKYADTSYSQERTEALGWVFAKILEVIKN